MSEVDAQTLGDFLDHTRQIAVAAGNAIVTVSTQAYDVETKGDGSPVTRADMASHEIIQEGLEALSPRFAIISEEGDLTDTEASSSQTYWLVDPLDGTKEFIKGLGEYTVNIALIERGIAVLGVVYVPVAGVTYYAARGLGAWKTTSGAQPQRIEASGSEDPITAVVSRSHLSDETEQLLAQLGVKNTEKHGSSVKLCAVAEGRADIYPRLGPTCLWDTAAGAAVAKEAGCRVEDIEGRNLSYDLDHGMLREAFVVYVDQQYLIDKLAEYRRNVASNGRAEGTAK